MAKKDVKDMSDRELMEDMAKRIRHIEISGDIQTGINIIVFLGVASLGALFAKLKTKVK